MDAVAIGVDLGGTHIKIGLADRNEGLIAQARLDTHSEGGPQAVIAQIVDGVRQMMKAAGDRPVRGIGIGAPGSVNWERTIVSYPSNLPGWAHVNLTKAIQGLMAVELPVIVENDANVAAFGSNFHGAGSLFESFIMVTLGTGVGGAIMYRDKLFRGTTGAAGEIGHLSIDYEGPRARSGVAGAVEAYLGQRFMSRHARYFLMHREESLVHEMTGGDLEKITPKLLYEAAEQGDPIVREFFGWAGHKLGCALASCVNLLDIRKFVVGGGVSAAGDLLLDPVRVALRNGVMPGLEEGLELVRETRGNEVGMLGAAHLAFEYYDEHTSEAF